LATGNGKSKGSGKKNSSFTIQQLINSRNLDFIVAALLITGKLDLDSVKIYKDGSLPVTLVGEFRKLDNKSVQNLMKFMDHNGSMTIDDVMEALRKRVQNGRGG